MKLFTNEDFWSIMIPGFFEPLVPRLLEPLYSPSCC